MSVTQTYLEKAYLAYFGRPIDPAGMAWYSQPGMTEAQVATEFSHSAESQALYGEDFDVAQLNLIYNVMFGRNGDVVGMTWWANQIAHNLVTPAGAAIAILNGAQGSDKIAVENKLAASHAFTAGLDTPAEILGYSGDAIAVARDFLSSITSTPATQAQINAAITSAVGGVQVEPPTGNEGDTITVSAHSSTTGIAVTCGVADDTINVDAGTLGATTIAGGGGNDHINLWSGSGGGQDQLVFGDIQYDTLQHQSLNSQGVDVITNFNFELNDVLNFQAFMGAVPEVQYAAWFTGVNESGTAGATNLYVVAALNNFVLTGADVSVASNGLHMADNGKGVAVVVAEGGDHANVYYVQDIDSGAGQAWAVDLVGQITSANDGGALTGIGAANFM